MIGIKEPGHASPSIEPYTLSYQVNGGPIVTETTGAVIAPNTSTNYTFTSTYDFSSPGVYTLQIWVSNSGDPQTGNDTLTTVIKQLQNDPVTLSPAFTEGFESTTAQDHSLPFRRTDWIAWIDVTSSPATLNGRARTFINSGFARTGNRIA